MPKRHKHEEHENHERWLVSYADFITLLFAFFVVMYAVSEVDAKKAKKVERSVQFAFHFEGTGGNDQLPIFDGPSGSNAIEPLMHGPKIVPISHDEIDQAEKNALDRVRQTLDDRLADMRSLGLDGMVERKLEERGLVIRLPQDTLFAPGDDTLEPAALPIVDRIASALATTGREVRVEGHADPRPIHSARFPSNWELSTARATGLVRYLVVQHGIAPERLSASGYAEYRPIDTNDTPEGRARNRRVDIVVLSRVAQDVEPGMKADLVGPRELDGPASSPEADEESPQGAISMPDAPPHGAGSPPPAD